MFKNFGKVFSFTFMNMIKSKSYKILTILFAVILLLAPSVICLIVASGSKKDDNKDSIDASGIETIYVVNQVVDADVNFNLLNTFGEENYDNINYTNEPNIDKAIKAASDLDNNGGKAVVLKLSLNDSSLETKLIVPDAISDMEDDINNYNDFVSKYSSTFIIMAKGFSPEQVQTLASSSKSISYNETGFSNGEAKTKDLSTMSNDEANAYIKDTIVRALKMILPFVNLFVFYMMVLFYCQSVSQSLVLEKQNKLMDTVLVSIKSEAFAAGKVLGINAAAILQLVIWIVSIVLGLVASVFTTDCFFPNVELKFIYFLKHISDFNVFEPGPVIISVIVLLAGFILYSSLAAIAGAMSKNREEANSYGIIYLAALIIAYFAVLTLGVIGAESCPVWASAIPFVAPLVVPGFAALSGITMANLIISLVAIIVLTVLLVLAAGRTYRAMSLFSGNKVSIPKLAKIIFTGKL